MQFIADRMLGSLARWLRAAGIDVEYDDSIDRSSMIRKAREEQRIILTRAENFKELKNIPEFILIESDNLKNQVSNVLTSINNRNLDIDILSRCLECNNKLKEISKEDVKGRVPEKSFNAFQKFKICHNCGKIYWEGTHIEKIISKLRELGLYGMEAE